MLAPLRAAMPGLGAERPYPLGPGGCMQGGYMCSTGVCVPTLWLCDGNPDCPLSEDEAPQICGKHILLEPKLL